MANVKEEGKKMDPLFPRLHISDADKGGPRTPPRNKMAISQQFNVPSQTAQGCVSGSVSVSRALPLSTNNDSRLDPTTSSYHDANYKRSMLSSFGRSCGSTRMATRLDSYHPSGINLNISLTTVKQTIETTNCQTLCNTGDPKPQEFRTTRNNTIVKKLEYEDDHLLPSFTFGNGQHNTNRGSFPPLSTNVYRKQLRLTDKDTTRENKVNTVTSKDIAREPVSCYDSNRDQFSETLNEDVSPSIKRRILIDDEQKMLHDPTIRLSLKRKSFQENMAYKDGTKKIWTLLGDNKKINGGTHEPLAPFNKSEEDHGSLHLGDPRKTTDRLETDFLSEFSIAPDKVSQIIGQEQYCIARRRITQQQRTFQSQLFELHRLIKVQKILAQSPDLLIEDDFYKLKKLPSEDMFPHLDHHKGNNDTEKIYNPNLVDLPLPPPPPPINGSKQPPWCFLPTPPLGNHWLVPVKSPSEGLVYKPIAGPSPPPIGLMPPAYGMSLTPSNADFFTSSYNIPTSYQQGLGLFPSTTLLTSYGFPTITKHICSPAIDDSVNYSRNGKTACNTESDFQGSSGSSSSERKKDELPLFPTTPMARDSDQCTEQKQGFDERIKVIKVVPHNPKLASESAARIFQFIQEERKHTE